MATRPVAIPYAPQLDGLRAVSVLAVAWSHWLPGYQFGLPLGAGVHLFFVLSGFLITRILLGLRDAPDRRAAVGRFFLRRALRLVPAFVVVLALAWMAEIPRVAETWPWHAAYLSNVYIAGQAAWQGHLSHFWSLAVEQQFYLVWPWLIVWTPRRWLAPIVCVVALVGPAVHLAAAARGLDASFWALVPGGSLDSLGLGALVALAKTSARSTAARRLLDRAAMAGGVAWLAMAGLHLAPDGDAWPLLAGRQFLQGLVFAWVVGRTADGMAGPAGRVLAAPGVVAVGRISYGVYLVHPFAPVVIEAIARAAGLASTAAWPPVVRAGVAWGATLAMASALWHLVEAPAHRLKARW